MANKKSPLDYLAPSVRALSPYNPGRSIAEVAAERGVTDVVKLASNENPLGAGKLALAALREMAAEGVSRYPPPDGAKLAGELARRLEVNKNQIVLGNGSNDILVLAGQLLLAPGSAAVYSQHAFLVYGLIAAGARAESIVVPAHDFAHDLGAMAKAAQQSNARLVFVANPNNPTGTFHAPEVVRGFMREVPEDVLVVLDEAYCEYAPDEGRAFLPLLAEFANLLITRTFSKIHGLAGLRAGYGIGNEKIIAAINQVRQPFNINAAAQAAALAALADDEHIRRSRKTNDEGMKMLRAGLDSLGVEHLPSAANFISARFDNAAEVYECLLDCGVIARRLVEYEMPDWLRVTIGDENENKKFLSALRAALQK